MHEGTYFQTVLLCLNLLTDVCKSEQQVFGCVTVSGNEITGNLHYCNSEIDLSSASRLCDPGLTPTQNWNTAKEHVWMLELENTLSWSKSRKNSVWGPLLSIIVLQSIGSPLYYAPQHLCPLGSLANAQNLNI